MVNEQVLVEWEITLKCNYKCAYCCSTNTRPTAYRPNSAGQSPPILDKNKIEAFIKMLGETYPGVEIFIFGGEPFIHPHIEFIIQTFNKNNIPFVIQTNLSRHSVKIMEKIKDPSQLQVSIHPTEVSLEDVIIPPDANIRVIDVMYTGREALKYYFKVKGKAPEVYLTPVAAFGTGTDDALKDFNKIRKDPKWQKLVNFETVKRLGEYRSNLWENYNPRGKPCMYNGRYFLYSPAFELYNCCYRINHDGVCPRDKCFFM